MGRALTIFFGLLAFGLLVWVCLGHQDVIQREIADNARAALAADGHEFVRASAVGQTVVLSGTAESASQRTAAESSVAAVPGVRHIDNKIALLADVPPPGPDSKPIVRELEPVEPVGPEAVAAVEPVAQDAASVVPLVEEPEALDVPLAVPEVAEVTEVLPEAAEIAEVLDCLLYTSPSPRDKRQSRMPSSA